MRLIDPSLDRLVGLSRLAMAWEALWRIASAAAAIVALYLAVSWFGLWAEVPPLARMAGTALFGLLLLLAVRRALRRWDLSRRQALVRLDRASGDPHAVATSLDDAPANAVDPATAALWRVHRARLAARIAGLRVAAPSPRAVDVDRVAWRAGAALLALVALVHAGPNWKPRLLSGFDWRSGANAGPAYRVDAWIDPPPYTGKAPILISGGGARAERRKFAAPVGSTVVVRATGPSAPDVSVEGGLIPAPPPATDGAGASIVAGTRFQLKGDGAIKIGPDRFDVAAIPDRPPSIELTEQPRANLRGSLTIVYRTADDYGVSAVEAQVADAEIEGRVAQGKPLIDPPRWALGLPPGGSGLGEGQATADISESPWAGARVSFTLRARDDGGNEGVSEPISIYLPQRPFTKPLARALVEQRRNLVLEPQRRGRVLSALNALMLEPELFTETTGVYLGLKVAASGLANARKTQDLLDVADLLWAMALQIEDGGASDAERDLRAAEKALREALQNHASDEEIRRLAQELRQAMDRFLAEMARKAPGDREQAESAPRDGARTVTPQQLKDMLDQMEAMARSGDRQTAQQMLEQLQNMLENLRTARRGGAQDRAQRELNRALGDMDRLMRDQQKLRDDTYRDGRNAESEQGAGERPGDKGRQSAQNLERRQAELQQRLDEIRRRLGPQGGKQLGEAQDAMGQAGKELGERGDRDKAVDAQGRALEALRQGADQLARRMQGQGQPSDQIGRGEGGPGEEADGGDPGEADPLGRPSHRSPRFNPFARYDPMGASPALRAQRVLEELRRRLGDVSRPQDELDYLERLLRRY